VLSIIKEVVSATQLVDEWGFDPTKSETSLTLFTPDQLKSLAQQITQSVTYKEATVFSSFLALQKTGQKKFTVERPEGKGVISSDTQLVIESWGSRTQKAILTVFADFTGTISKPTDTEAASVTAKSRSMRATDPAGGPGGVNRYHFVFRIDRFNSEGQLTNDEWFCFTFNTSASEVGVLVKGYEASDTWKNIKYECVYDGVNRWCGNCTHDGTAFTCCSPHTSAFTSFDFVPIQKSSGTGINMVLIIVPAAVVSGLGVILLIALYCICVSRRPLLPLFVADGKGNEWTPECNGCPTARPMPYHV